MTNLEKKILIHLFLLRTEPRKEEYRLDRYTIEEIQKKVLAKKKETTEALCVLYLKQYIGKINSTEHAYFIEREGCEKAVSLILSLTETLR